MTSNNGSSLAHSSDGTAERAYPALLSSSPGTASDSTTEYLLQTLVPHEESLERDLEQIMEEDWHVGQTSSSPAATPFHDAQQDESMHGQHLGDTPVGPGLLSTLSPGSGFMGPVQGYPPTFDMTREVVQRGRLERPGSGRSSTPTGHGLPPLPLGDKDRTSSNTPSKRSHGNPYSDRSPRPRPAPATPPMASAATTTQWSMVSQGPASMQSVSTPLPSSTSSMPSTLYPATALAPLQQPLSQTQEFEMFAQQLLDQNQTMAATANAEIGQRDAAIAAETQRRIAAEQTAGHIHAAAEQQVGSLQGLIQIN